jgi:type IV pilus assembly protein PilO
MKLPQSLAGLASFDFNQIADDFRRLNNNDPGTWPLIPKITILLGLFLAVLLAGWWFFWQEEIEALDVAQAKEASLREEYLGKKRQAVNLDLYLQQLDEIDKSFGTLLKQLPNRAEVDSLLVEVNQAGLGRGLQFELFKPAQEVVKEFYAELPIAVKINGSYHDLGAFAADVAKLPRIVTLNNIAIVPAQGAGSAGRLAMDMEIKTFRYLDDEEMASRRQAGKAKGGNK